MQSDAIKLIHADESADPSAFQRHQWEVDCAAFPTPWRLADLDPGPHRTAMSLYLEDRCAAFIYGQKVADEAEIWRIGTRPRLRGQGLAGRLLTGFIDRMKQTGVETVFLEVSSANQPALGLYRGFGFQEIGRRKGYYQSGEDALNMALRLTPGSR